MTGLDTQDWVTVAVVFAVGWFAHMGWDALCDFVLDAADGARSVLVDVFAVVGALTVAVFVGYVVTH